MSIFSKKKQDNVAPSGPVDPLSGLGLAPEEPAPQPSQPSPRRSIFSRRRQNDQIVRVDELERILRETDGDIDPDAVLSLYVPHRRARLFGAALLRLDKLYLALLGLLLVLAILFIFSFMQEKMGNFTINLNRLEMYRKGIAIASDGDFTDATARLKATAVEDATNISIDDLPENIDDIDGDHNGQNYMAYTYYVRNAGKVDTSYYASLTLDSCAKGAEYAVRIAIWKNGERTVYAMPALDGDPERGCVNFINSKLVCTYTEPEFLVGNVDKYTVVIWMEGDDPECIDDIVGGSVQFTMNINCDDDEDSSLFTKFVQDIWDTLTGNKPIGASSSDDVPDYYKDHEVTWDTRRNKDNMAEIPADNT